MKSKNYLELCEIKTFEDRLDYLSLFGQVVSETFGGDRYLNQILYNSPEWRSFRKHVVIRDNGCDLGVLGYEIQLDSFGNLKGIRKPKIIIHHIIPITKDDIINRRSCLFDMNNVISSSFKTHTAIHYGIETERQPELICRKQNDTIPWRK